MPNHPCDDCKLRSEESTRDFDENEVSAIKWFRRGDLRVEAGSQIHGPGASQRLYTLYEGLAFRHVTLKDGRRQITNFLFPGDLIGLQASMLETPEHSVEALIDSRLCMFETRDFPELYRRAPEMGYDITWISASEQQFLDLNIVALGRYRGDERIAYFLLYYIKRMRATGRGGKMSVSFPIRQVHLSDALGLSVPYTSQCLKRLAEEGVCRVHKQTLHILDWERFKDRAVTNVKLSAKLQFI